MATGNKSFYEILGIGRDARAQEIDRAYARLRSQMQKESSAPNPRLAAMAKVAYETLSDPRRRDEYDASIGILKRPLRAPRLGRPMAALAAVALIGIAAAGYWFFARTPAKPLTAAGDKSYTPQELLQEVAPYLGRVQGAMVSGEVRDLGTAVAIGTNEMATTCRGIAAGMLLTVRQGDATTKAELARINEELDICTLAVKGVTGSVKTRGGAPGAQEKLQAVLLGNGPAEARLVTMARTIDDPRGQLFELKAAAPLPNGTPAFDSHARLVGIVTAPHEHGEGVVAALGASRIGQARAASSMTSVAANTATPQNAPAPTASAPAEPAAAPAAAAPSGGGPTMTDDGFATLWKEDSRGELIEVMDGVKKGTVGLPLAYWTLWSGRDPARPVAVHCLVTYGDDREVVADYDQVPPMPSAEGYWYCALTRFQGDLDSLPKGDYHFTIFANGRAVAEKSIAMDTRFFTPMMKIALVLVVGCGLLAFLKRNKPVRA